MADLVADSELATLLGGTPDPVRLQAAVDGAEDLFERLCGRTTRPFQAAQSGRVEVHDGTGSTSLFLQYPIADLTALLIGADPDEPDETLAVDDLTVLRWGVGSTLVRRVSGRFGCYGDPRVIHVTYDTADDLPAAAQQAVLHGAAILYHRAAAGGATSESLGDYRADYSVSGVESALAQNPAWREGLRVCSEVVIA